MMYSIGCFCNLLSRSYYIRHFFKVFWYHCSTIWLSALFLPYIHNLVLGGLRSGLMISLHFMLSFHLAYPERAMLSIIVCKGFLHFHWLAKIAREDYMLGSQIHRPVFSRQQVPKFNFFIHYGWGEVFAIWRDQILLASLLHWIVWQFSGQNFVCNTSNFPLNVARFLLFGGNA